MKLKNLPKIMMLRLGGDDCGGSIGTGAAQTKRVSNHEGYERTAHYFRFAAVRLARGRAV